VPMAEHGLLVFSWVPLCLAPGQSSSSSFSSSSSAPSLLGSLIWLRLTRAARPRPALRRRLFVNDLPGMIQLLFNLIPRATQPRLAEIDGVRQKRASCLNAACITAILQAHTFRLQEFRQIVVKLLFIDWSHKYLLFA
jgi:hypothetical protein